MFKSSWCLISTFGYLSSLSMSLEHCAICHYMKWFDLVIDHRFADNMLHALLYVPHWNKSSIKRAPSRNLANVSPDLWAIRIEQLLFFFSSVLFYLRRSNVSYSKKCLISDIVSRQTADDASCSTIAAFIWIPEESELKIWMHINHCLSSAKAIPSQDLEVQKLLCWDKIPRTCHVFTLLFTLNTPRYFLDFAFYNYPCATAGGQFVPEGTCRVVIIRIWMTRKVNMKVADTSPTIKSLKLPCLRTRARQLR